MRSNADDLDTDLNTDNILGEIWWDRALWFMNYTDKRSKYDFFTWIFPLVQNLCGKSISGDELDRFWKSRPYFGLFHAAWIMPQNSKIDDWMSFPEIGLLMPQKFHTEKESENFP